MARYIDADLIKNIELIPYKRKSGNINVIIANMAIAGAKQVVDKIPTADVAPVTHAHWARSYKRPGVYEFIGWYCTNCNSRTSEEYAPHWWLYCPHCGAKMDEEVDNDTI